MGSKDNQTQFSTLDSLRGFAAIAIAVFHFFSGWGGYLAVDFFLVLSGFVLSHSYLYKYETISPVKFIGHRLARLYPLHIYTLLTFIGATLLVSKGLPSYKDGTLFTLFQQITITHNVGLNPGGMTWNYPSWSISVEFWVNLIFIFFISRETKNIILFLLALFGLVVIYVNTGHLDTHATNYYTFLNSGMIRGVSTFFLGILSYRIYLYYKKYRDSRTLRFISYLETACLIGVSIIVFGRKGDHSGLDFLAPYLFMLVVVVFSFEHGKISKFLKKFSYFGIISYSIYLNQITVLILSKYLLHKLGTPDKLIFAVYILALLVYSHFTYRYIERPLRQKGRNLFSRISHAVTRTRLS
jgi:peptidoglycan/LPS O-acetylase OafA/YrhL